MPAGRYEKVQIGNGSEATKLVRNLIRNGSTTEDLQKLTGQPRQSIAAIRAHMTMGTYRDGGPYIQMIGRAKRTTVA